MQFHSKTSYQFKIHLSPLLIQEVEKQIEVAVLVQVAYSFHFENNPFLCFIRLSMLDIMELMGTFKVEELQQVQIRHSILLENQKSFLNSFHPHHNVKISKNVLK